MWKFAAGAACALVLLMATDRVDGHDEASKRIAAEEVIARTLKIVDDQKRVRIAIGMEQQPKSGAYLKFMDGAGKLKIHMHVDDKGPGMMWMYDEDGGVFLQMIGVGNAESKGRGGVVRVLGLLDGVRTSAALLPNRLEFQSEFKRTHVYPPQADEREDK